jgi:hypothetical protein
VKTKNRNHNITWYRLFEMLITKIPELNYDVLLHIARCIDMCYQNHQYRPKREKVKLNQKKRKVGFPNLLF